MLRSRCRNHVVLSIIVVVSIILMLPLAASRVDADGGPIDFGVDPPLEPAKAQTEERWLGLKPADSASCPEPMPNDPAWRTAPLFAPSPSTGGPAVLPPILTDVCDYQMIGDSGGGTDEDARKRLQNLLRGGQLLRLEPDLAAVTPAGSGVLASRLWPTLREQLDAQAGRTPLGIAVDATPVRLAVVDTEPNSPFKTARFLGRSPHGHTLLAMAEHLLCSDLAPNTSCPAFLTARLGLPLYRDASGDIVYDDRDGGEFGSMAFLARAIQDEVEDWLHNAPEGQPLVLNLSLGWARHYGGWQPDPDDMPLPVWTVYKALHYARCHGALIIAAAGNHIGGPAEPQADGPWFPGGWERRAALGHSACEAALDKSLSPNKFPVTNAYAPLVYAAAGVQGDGQPLTNASPNSAPRLVAYADHAVVEGHRQGHPTAILTGSSVATLLAASAAAAVWSQLPALPPHEVMDLLYKGGDPLALHDDNASGRYADVCLPVADGTGCAPDGHDLAVRRLSLCTALREVCSDPRAACAAAPPSCAPWQPSHAGMVLAADADVQMSIHTFEAETPDSISTDTLIAPIDATPPCGVWDLSTDPTFGKPSDPCPHRQYRTAEARPWVRTAPASVPCSTCAVCLSTRVVLIEIDQDFEGSLSQPTLEMGSMSYSLPLSVLQPGTRAVVRFPMLPTGPIKLSFTVDGRTSVLNPVLVVP